jgi:hypothetical protein
MAANLRFSTNTVNGKNYLGGIPVAGAPGIFNQNMVTTNAVFDEILKSENIAGTVDYRCLYFQNDYTGTQQVYQPTISILATTTTAIFSIGLLTDKNVTAASITDENTAPSGITFTTPAVGDTPISLIQGTTNALSPGEYVGFWIKRQAVNIGGSGTVTGQMQFQVQFKT